MQESRRDYRDLTSEPLSHDAQAVINARPQHTPGPWTVSPDRDAWGFYMLHEVSAHECDECAICDDGIEEHCERCGVEHDEANARLIAAAPDLLAALEAAATSIALAAEMMRAKGIDGAGASLELDASRARLAIAKARGQ